MIFGIPPSVSCHVLKNIIKLFVRHLHCQGSARVKFALPEKRKICLDGQPLGTYNFRCYWIYRSGLFHIRVHIEPVAQTTFCCGFDRDTTDNNVFANGLDGKVSSVH